MIKKITQSFMKSMRSYLAGEECGNIVKAQWVEDRLLDLELDDEDEAYGVKPADLGAYFEFISWGGLPKNKIPPKAKMQQSGKDMLKPYKVAEINSKRIRAYFEEMGLVVVAIGKTLTKGRFEGTIDLKVECTKLILFPNGLVWNIGDKLVIDLKYSGLISDKWNKHGWKWSDIQKEYHGTQAKQYHYVSGLPFYFLVCSSKNERDIEMFYVPVDKDMIDQHIKEGNFLFDAFNLHREIGLTPRPKVSKCLKCPLFNECEDKHTYPHPEIVDLNIE